MSTKNGGTNTEKVVKSKALVAREAKELASKERFRADIAAGKAKMDLNGLVERANKGEAPAKKLKAVVKSISKKTKEEAKPKVDRAAERRSFIKQNATTIMKAWNAMEEGKRSAMGMNRVLPSEWSHKWVDEVLHLAGVRKSGEEVVIKAVAEDKALLEELVMQAQKANKPKAKANGKAKANSEAQVQA